MFQTIQLLIQCGTLLAVAFLVLLAMPQSKLRDVLMPVLGWAFTLICGIYVISPLDIVPDVIPVAGWIDDAGAIIAGIASAKAAMNAGHRASGKSNRSFSRN